MNTPRYRDLSFILDGFVSRPDVRHALVLSTDGLVVQSSSSLNRDDADRMAAATASIHSLAYNIADIFDSGPVGHSFIQYENHTLFVAAAGRNTRLVVLCDKDVDMGDIAYQMSLMVTRIGEFLGSEARSATSSNGHPGPGHV